MAVVAKNLQPGATLTADAASVVTAQTAVTTIVSNGVVSNPTNAAVTLTIQIQRSGGSALDLVPGRAVQAAGTDLLPELNGRVLAAGDEILASGAGLVLFVDGNTLS
ncbi:hypothetical protein [Acidomonas methanolica]|uniref:Uncharacterized protein n=1 Tax=Acidomonas methanolica NBRC 104435 TaxID=1231351 RepID=A0A023D6N1_ACIMT|nr:hypothetical protein [Acidomonas methanolica]TCS24114.1 hypothetical protein EDC31_12535 [Acidomonas methanolica]GAJ29734.1 hypothetical protein Amme_076_027 [Acidomonas methanolica NBRC 104435]GBQ59440.1 hypothetical protein AA0498_2754 [Acidomonas methanolica]GEL00029.1 hypothetical protein AME01nite_25270 [Acidomonas methanolica NBRC 104435]